MVTPAPGALNTSRSITGPPPSGRKLSWIVRAPSTWLRWPEAGWGRAGAVELDLGGPILVAESVTRDDHRLIPVSHDARHVLADDGLAENRAVENVADGPVGAAPHLLQVELLDAPFVRSD